MGFTVFKAGDLNTNERLIAFFKKELQFSHIINTAKKQKHYGTKRYRKNVSHDFPSKRRYIRLKALVSNQYKTNQARYNLFAQLGKMV